MNSPVLNNEVVKTLSDISDKINTGVILIPTDLDEHITTLRLSTASESNSIAGINIQKKDLPRQATKTQMQQGRDNAQQQCPICNQQFSRKRKITQCQYCSRSCCNECCFKVRMDAGSKQKLTTCNQCELVLLHWMVNEEFRKSSGMLREAICYTESLIKKVQEDKVTALREDCSHKQNPSQLGRLMRISQLGRVIKRDKGLVAKGEKDVLEWQAKVQHGKAQIALRRQQRQQRKYLERRQRERAQQQQAAEKEKATRQAIRRQEEEKAMGKLLQQTHNLIKQGSEIQRPSNLQVSIGFQLETCKQTRRNMGNLPEVTHLQKLGQQAEALIGGDAQKMRLRLLQLQKQNRQLKDLQLEEQNKRKAQTGRIQGNDECSILRQSTPEHRSSVQKRPEAQIIQVVVASQPQQTSPYLKKIEANQQQDSSQGVVVSSTADLIYGTPEPEVFKHLIGTPACEITQVLANSTFEEFQEDGPRPPTSRPNTYNTNQLLKEEIFRKNNAQRMDKTPTPEIDAKPKCTCLTF